jgi:hypothetical protein
MSTAINRSGAELGPRAIAPRSCRFQARAGQTEWLNGGSWRNAGLQDLQI